MPRTNELKAEEAVVSSPLRRSSRIIAVSSSAPVENCKPIKGRRLSASQQNDESEEKSESKQAPARAKRGNSVTKENIELKPEPAKPRTRRSSASAEPTTKTEEQPRAPVTRRRRSSATEEIQPEAPKPVRSRRSSASDDTAKVTTTAKQRSTAPEEVAEDNSKTKPPATRRRSISRDEVVEDVKPLATRSRRRSSVEQLEELQPKAKPQTPVKRRRPSVTDNAAASSLEPIEEVEGERKSLSPVADKTSPHTLTPVKKKLDGGKVELDLSIINEEAGNSPVKPTEKLEDEAKLEGSIVQTPVAVEVQQGGGERTSTTPKKSPRFRQSSDEVVEESEPLLQLPEDTKANQSESIAQEVAGQRNSSDKLELVINLESKVTIPGTTPNKSPRKSPRIQARSKTLTPPDLAREPAETNTSNCKEQATCKEVVDSESREEVHSPKKCLSFEDDSVFASKAEESEEGDRKASTTCSESSFKFNLSNSKVDSTPGDTEEDEDVLNTSKTSNSSSDKENILLHDDSSVSKKLLGNVNTKESKFEQSVTLARVSNVFRPKNVDFSFMEPMDVDMTMVNLDATTFEKLGERTLLPSGATDDSVDESFKLSLSVTHVESPSSAVFDSPAKDGSKEPARKENVEDASKAASIESENIESAEEQEVSEDQSGDEFVSKKEGMSPDYEFQIPSEDELDVTHSLKSGSKDAEELSRPGSCGKTETAQENEALEMEPSSLSSESKVVSARANNDENVSADAPAVRKEEEKESNRDLEEDGSKLKETLLQNGDVTVNEDIQKEEESGEGAEGEEKTIDIETIEEDSPKNNDDEANQTEEEPSKELETVDEKSIEKVEEEVAKVNEEVADTLVDNIENIQNEAAGEVIEDEFKAVDSEYVHSEEKSLMVVEVNEEQEMVEKHLNNSQSSIGSVKAEEVLDAVAASENKNVDMSSDTQAPEEIKQVEEHRQKKEDLEDTMSSKKNDSFREEIVIKEDPQDSKLTEDNTMEKEEILEGNQPTEEKHDEYVEMEKSFQDVVNDEASVVEITTPRKTSESQRETKKSRRSKGEARSGGGVTETKVVEEHQFDSKKTKKRAKLVAVLDESNEAVSDIEEVEPENVGSCSISKKSKKKKNRKDAMPESEEKQEEEEEGNKSFSLKAWFSENLPEEAEVDNKSQAKEDCGVEKSEKKKSPSLTADKTLKQSPEETKDTTQKRQSLEEFANSKLDEFLSKKMVEMDECEEEAEEEEYEENPYLDTMAEEGEEDTPSPGSNDIIDDGESINTTESDIETDDEIDSDMDSFICHEEVNDLLSGDEYDLEDMKMPTRKSRIINVDGYEDDVIKIARKEKPIEPKKKSRIIQISSSSEEDAEEKVEESVKEGAQETVEPLVAEVDVSTTEKSKKRRSSITIIENINVSEIKDAVLSQRIHNLVDSFCTTIPDKGDISMNLSLEYSDKDSSKESFKGEAQAQKSPVAVEKSLKEARSKKSKSAKRSSTSSKEAGVPVKKQRLSVSLDNIEDSTSLTGDKRRLSKSLEELKTKKRKKKSAKTKGVVASKKTRLSYSEDDLRTQTFSILNQLITDVKNRPRRTVKPSTSKVDPDMDDSWVVEVADLKPSTSVVSKKEIEDYKMKKVHPKDFRSQMLYDSSRVKRVDTKKLLRKKNVFI